MIFRKYNNKTNSIGSQGFCILNNVAIGAAYAKYMWAKRGITRVAIIDFDVHHGNGTEQIIRNMGWKWRKIQVTKLIIN